MPNPIVPWDCGMTSDEFRAWQEQQNLSGADISRMFRVSLNTVTSWRKRGTPVLVRYACMAVAMGYKVPEKT